MAKSETVKKDITSEEPAVAKTTLVEKPVPTPVVQDNRGFVLAVAGAVVLFIVGIILGTITGTWLADFFRSLLLFGTILILVISVMATAGLLLAVSYHARKMRVAAIVSLLIVSMFLPQFGAGVAQTPVEQTRQACEQAPGLFPADCP